MLGVEIETLVFLKHCNIIVITLDITFFVSFICYWEEVLGRHFSDLLAGEREILEGIIRRFRSRVNILIELILHIQFTHENLVDLIQIS